MMNNYSQFQYWSGITRGLFQLSLDFLMIWIEAQWPRIEGNWTTRDRKRKTRRSGKGSGGNTPDHPLSRPTEKCLGSSFFSSLLSNLHVTSTQQDVAFAVDWQLSLTQSSFNQFMLLTVLFTNSMFLKWSSHDIAAKYRRSHPRRIPPCT